MKSNGDAGSFILLTPLETRHHKCIIWADRLQHLKACVSFIDGLDLCHTHTHMHTYIHKHTCIHARRFYAAGSFREELEWGNHSSEPLLSPIQCSCCCRGQSGVANHMQTPVSPSRPPHTPVLFLSCSSRKQCSYGTR